MMTSDQGGVGGPKAGNAQGEPRNTVESLSAQTVSRHLVLGFAEASSAVCLHLSATISPNTQQTASKLLRVRC